jgi:putative salt-induced outer membrane protein YdiY
MGAQTKAVILAASFVLAVFQMATADELRLTNGDVITGTFVRMQDSKVVFQTDYAGEIAVDWQKISRLLTDQPVKVVLSDGTVLEGHTEPSQESMMRLTSAKLATPSDFEMADVAAVNPEPKPPVKITTRANVGLSQERGNTDTDSLRLDGEFIARTEKSRYTILGELDSEKENGDTTVEKWTGFGDYNYFMLPKWFLYANTLFEHDKFADLDLRSTAGVGAGHQFFESETLNLFASAGPAWVNEDFKEAEDDDYSAGQWRISYDQYFFGKFVQLFHRQIGFLKLADTEKWVLKTRQGLRFPLKYGLTATLQYNYDYDNEPSEDAEEKWDSKLMFLIGWQFDN